MYVLSIYNIYLAAIYVAVKVCHGFRSGLLHPPRYIVHNTGVRRIVSYHIYALFICYTSLTRQCSPQATDGPQKHLGFFCWPVNRQTDRQSRPDRGRLLLSVCLSTGQQPVIYIYIYMHDDRAGPWWLVVVWSVHLRVWYICIITIIVMVILVLFPRRERLTAPIIIALKYPNLTLCVCVCV